VKRRASYFHRRRNNNNSVPGERGKTGKLNRGSQGKRIHTEGGNEIHGRVRVKPTTIPDDISVAGKQARKGHKR